MTKRGYTYEQDGAVWFKATEFGADKDFVLVRANGIPTYIVPDIAYHYDKLMTRHFDRAIDILGADHHGYVPRLKAALTAMGADANRLDVVLMQMVMLMRDGEVVKLSKRSGKAITLVTLLDEIPIVQQDFSLIPEKQILTLNLIWIWLWNSPLRIRFTMFSMPMQEFAACCGTWKKKAFLWAKQICLF